MKGFIRENKFHPITTYNKLKKNEVVLHLLES